MTQVTKGLSAVIPVFNAELTLPDVVTRLAILLPTLAETYELILVDDGSHDHSWDIISAFAQENPAVRGIKLARNFGQHNATLAGIRAARLPIVLTMDSDGQHPPEEINKLLAVINEGYDVAYGYTEKPQHGYWRNWITFVFRWVFHQLRLFPDSRRVSAFRAFRLEVRDAFAQCNAPYVTVDALLRWGTDRFGFVRVRLKPRLAGKSSSTPKVLFTMAINGITGHSLMPVHLVVLGGVGISIAGALCFLFAATPLSWLAGVIGMGVGVVTTAIGIVGEYVARNYMLALGKPQSLVRTRIGMNE